MVGCVHHIYPAQESGREFSSPSHENSRVDCWLWVGNVSHFYFFFRVVHVPMVMMMFNSMDNEGENGKNLAHTYGKSLVRDAFLKVLPLSSLTRHGSSKMMSTELS